MSEIRERAHFPGRAPLDAYGNGGFRFADMSHRGSILCLPSGIYGWDRVSARELDTASFSRAVTEAADIEILLIGTGVEHVLLPKAVREHLTDAGLRFDVMATGPASRTYNVLMSDQRKVAAALIAVDTSR